MCVFIWLRKNRILWKQPSSSDQMVCQELTAPFQDTSPLFTLSIPQWRKGGSLKQNLTLHLTGIKASWGQTKAMGIKKGLFTLPAAATWATINIQPPALD